MMSNEIWPKLSAHSLRTKPPRLVQSCITVYVFGPFGRLVRSRCALSFHHKFNRQCGL